MTSRRPARPAGASIAEPSSSASAIGRIVHLLVAESVNAGIYRVSAQELRDFIWLRTADLATSQSFGRAVRSARVAIAGHTAVYLRRFAPPFGWSLLGSEIDLGSAGRADLGWISPDDRILLDELKFAGGIHVPVGDGPTRQQARRYAVAAVGRWGERFIGVRVVLLGAPRRSFFIRPDLKETPLLSSPYWFDARVVSPETPS